VFWTNWHIDSGRDIDRRKECEAAGNEGAERFMDILAIHDSPETIAAKTTANREAIWLSRRVFSVAG
jgi:hypothetical protein